MRYKLLGKSGLRVSELALGKRIRPEYLSRIANPAYNPGQYPVD